MERNKLTWKTCAFLQGVSTHQGCSSSQTDAKSLRLGRYHPFILSCFGGGPTPLAGLNHHIIASSFHSLISKFSWPLPAPRAHLACIHSHPLWSQRIPTLLTWRRQLSSLACLSWAKLHCRRLFAYTLSLLTLVLLLCTHSAVHLSACPA